MVGWCVVFGLALRRSRGAWWTLFALSCVILGVCSVRVAFMGAALSLFSSVGPSFKGCVRAPWALFLSRFLVAFVSGFLSRGLSAGWLLFFSGPLSRYVRLVCRAAGWRRVCSLFLSGLAFRWSVLGCWLPFGCCAWALFSLPAVATDLCCPLCGRGFFGSAGRCVFSSWLFGCFRSFVIFLVCLCGFLAVGLSLLRCVRFLGACLLLVFSGVWRVWAALLGVLRFSVFRAFRCCGYFWGARSEARAWLGCWCSGLGCLPLFLGCGVLPFAFSSWLRAHFISVAW
ncbi:hypothetical protein SAMN04488032_103246 [Pacificibacter marinus]|nr:hypothetical protein SAMN04488032_103246 [Pacificibacter marinus]